MKHFNIALLFIIGSTALQACGFGYSVEPRWRTSSENAQRDLIYWECKYTKPAFFRDLTIAVCDTKDECNEICAKERSKE